jgi:hypothetical protein
MWWLSWRCAGLIGDVVDLSEDVVAQRGCGSYADLTSTLPTPNIEAKMSGLSWHHFGSASTLPEFLQL